MPHDIFYSCSKQARGCCFIYLVCGFKIDYDKYMARNVNTSSKCGTKLGVRKGERGGGGRGAPPLTALTAHTHLYILIGASGT